MWFDIQHDLLLSKIATFLPDVDSLTEARYFKDSIYLYLSIYEKLATKTKINKNFETIHMFSPCWQYFLTTTENCGLVRAYWATWLPFPQGFDLSTTASCVCPSSSNSHLSQLFACQVAPILDLLSLHLCSSIFSSHCSIWASWFCEITVAGHYLPLSLLFLFWVLLLLKGS